MNFREHWQAMRRLIPAGATGLLCREVPVTSAVLTVALILIAYFYVPTSRTCHADVKLHPYVGATDIECSNPVFTIRCYESSVYQRAHDRAEVLCRTWRGRAVRVIDDAKRRRGDCQRRLGWLANYSPEQRCYCDPHSEQRNGLCLPTDRWCQQRFGTGGVAVFSPTGDRFNCGCGTGFVLSTNEPRCEAAAGGEPSATLTLFPLRP